MPHETALITTIAGAFVSAWVMGSLALRLGLSPIRVRILPVSD